MTGRWILCGNESVFGVDGGDVGLEITADHHWYKLFEAQGGATIRGAGFDEEGTWMTALTLSNQPQVNFDTFGGGEIIVVPAFASTPRAMRLDNMGLTVGNYVIDPTFPTGSVRCAPRPDPTRSGDCTPPSDTLIEQDSTVDVAVARTVGRWSRCGGSMPGAPLHDGIELTADGSFYFLHNDPTAGLVRGTSDTDVGKAKIDKFYNDPNIVITTLAGASINSSMQHFQSTPPQLWLTTTPEYDDPERYTFVSGSAALTPAADGGVASNQTDAGEAGGDGGPRLVQCQADEYCNPAGNCCGIGAVCSQAPSDAGVCYPPLP